MIQSSKELINTKKQRCFHIQNADESWTISTNGGNNGHIKPPLQINHNVVFLSNSSGLPMVASYFWKNSNYTITMLKTILIKKVYTEAFRNLGNQIVKNGFKIYFWICTALFAMVLYAFAYRLINGFIWD
tara:strand:- start:31574 stop:31963 length:390 start_codon:yes stop_codon:yes gene_type:complete